MDQHLICLETEVANEDLMYYYSGDLSVKEIDALVVELQKSRPTKMIWILGGPIFLN
ncbi:MAG: hypothetical protein ACXWCG_08585 [Flavitalea sp.]